MTHTLERETRFELATFSLEGWHSTNWVIPAHLSISFVYFGCGGWIWTNDLRVMSPTSYQAALLRDIYGASGRTRTGTGLLPQDFKSCVSTISPPRLTYRDNIYIIIFFIFCQEKILVPKKGFEPSTLRVWTACSSQLSYLGTLTITILS